MQRDLYELPNHVREALDMAFSKPLVFSPAFRRAAGKPFASRETTPAFGPEANPNA
ncbi:MAG TPA: hypothetical protein PLO23_05835 [Alphaproteobacteria bacterium]|nr:hypothetical protein [Alphaproteobacteria bacterium]